MNKANECTCPSGDGSLVHPCPAHPAVDQADVAAKLTFINGRPAMCGCQVEYSDGGGEYSDVIYVTLCAKHSGSAILDLVATNRIALTPEYEGQWHADLYLDREIPLAKVEGATPAEAVLALMSAERIDPEQESVEQAGGDERAAFNAYRDRRNALLESEGHKPGSKWHVTNAHYPTWEASRAALAQPSPKCATCNDSGQIVVSGPHYQGEFQPPEYETEPCDMCAQPSPAQADEKPGDSILCYGCFAKGVGPDHFDEAGKCLAAQAEQAEAERPIVSFEKYMQVMYDRDEHAKRLEAALARVAELEHVLQVVVNAADHGSWPTTVMYGIEKVREVLAGSGAPSQAQHSVPDGTSDLCRFLAKLYCELDGLRYSTAKLPAEQIADALIFKWPVLQGARNQLNIKRISEQPYDESKLHSAIAAMLAAAPGKEVPQAWLDVQAERRRQVEAEGWTPEHDDKHSHGQMARAAACYALAGSSAPSDGTAALLVSLAWPWDEQWWKPSTARRDLVKACALALAEIERLDRAGISQSPQPGATTASS